MTPSRLIALVARGLPWPRTPRGLPPALRRLPLVEERARAPGRTFAFVFSGDGNWAMLLRSMARELARHGIGTVGLKARTYLRRRRTPDAVARDVEAVLRHALAVWEQDHVVVAGFSRGAELLPFVVRRLPDDLRRRVVLLALLSPARSTNFRFHWADLFRQHERPDDVPLLPELHALAGMPILCVGGAEDRAALCPSLPPGRSKSPKCMLPFWLRKHLSPVPIRSYASATPAVASRGSRGGP